MTAIQRGIICFGILFIFIWLWRRATPDMTIVYPDNCVFTIDKNFSSHMQHDIKDFIDQAYKKGKKPSDLLPKIESHFPCIKSIVIDMENPELLNFTIKSYQPLFLINDEHVVCFGGKIFQKSEFSQEVLASIYTMNFDDVPSPKNIERLVSFYEKLMNRSNSSDTFLDTIFRDFSIRWIDKHTIWFDQKEGKDLSLLVDYDAIPTMQDIVQCRKVREQIVDKPCKDKRGKPCKKTTSWVCDLRFDQQVVLFSTNKGV